VGFDTPNIATVRTGKVELGQGILTALRQMAAEELRITPDRIRLISGRTDLAPDEGYTAGSLSVVTSGGAIRVACAQARTILVGRFASRLGCAPEDVVVMDGSFSASNAAEISSYWQEYAAEHFRVPIHHGGALTDPAEFKWIGKSLQRVELQERLSGGAFIHDLDFPEMLHAHAVRGSGQEIDQLKLERLRAKYAPGASFVNAGKFLAVYTDSEDLTRRVSEVVRQNLFPDSREEQLASDPKDFPSRSLQTAVYEMPGDSSLRNSARHIRARYSRPYISHGSIGPSCAIAHFDGERLQVWTHSQGVYALRAALARVLKLDPVEVVVYHVYGAGCYGHNGADDVAFDAAMVATHVPGRHVKVQWTRRDELRNAPFGAASLVQIEAGIDQNGVPTSWSIEIWSPTHIQRPGSRGAPGLLGAEEIDFEANKVPPGDVPLERGAGLHAMGSLCIDCRVKK
jgi:nicotinate dehydrogenase subunit B